MKIGILTYHRAHNYGAVLQAIATRFWLTKLGHNVNYIDYWPQYHKDMYGKFSLNKILRIKGFQQKAISLMYVLYQLPYLKLINKRIDKFNDFIDQYISPYCISPEESIRYNAVLYGSDQIWRKQQGLGNTLNPVYFGEGSIKADKHIAYAASMGVISLNDSDKDTLKEWLQKFDLVTVREEDLQKLLNGIGIQSQLVIDPTLMLDSDEWESTFKTTRLINEKYILYYRLQKDAFIPEEISAFAKERGCKLVVIGSGVVRSIKCDYRFTTAGPYEFLSLIRYADFVFTTSFHGLAFSIIFNKPFYASFSHNSERAATLLKTLDLSEFLLAPRTTLPSKYNEIDYNRVNKIIDNLKEQTTIYIQNALTN